MIRRFFRFVVNSTTGQISLKSEPDYEMAKLYEFQVIATDGGGSSSKSSSTNVKVEITDTNDNDPSFTNLPTKISVPENKAPGRIFTVQVSHSFSDLFQNGLFVAVMQQLRKVPLQTMACLF